MNHLSFIVQQSQESFTKRRLTAASAVYNRPESTWSYLLLVWLERMPSTKGWKHLKLLTVGLTGANAVYKRLETPEITHCWFDWSECHLQKAGKHMKLLTVGLTGASAIYKRLESTWSYSLLVWLERMPSIKGWNAHEVTHCWFD